MDEDVRDFLRKFSLGELTERGVLRGETPLLRGLSVPLLIALMKEHGVNRLTAQERNWYLTADGEFSNPGSKDILQGQYGNLDRHGQRISQPKPSHQSALDWKFGLPVEHKGCR